MQANDALSQLVNIVATDSRLQFGNMKLSSIKKDSFLLSVSGTGMIHQFLKGWDFQKIAT
jgi:hypothetical protein